MSDLEREREDLADDEAGADFNDPNEPDPGEPWAKTSSGDAESVTSDED